MFVIMTPISRNKKDLAENQKQEVKK